MSYHDIESIDYMGEIVKIVEMINKLPKCAENVTNFAYAFYLQYVDNIKYLGVILANNLKDDLDISHHLRCLYVSANIIL